MKAYLLAVCLFAVGVLSASDSSRAEYLKLMREYPEFLFPIGDASKGEIEIVTDSDEMARIEQCLGQDVGLIQKDSHFIWLKDPCRYPNGSTGIYGRMIPVKKLQGRSGAIVLPVTEDQKIALICIFRHSTRSWEIELPRGWANLGETLEETARREVLEEMGLVLGDVKLIGWIAPYTGLVAYSAPIFQGSVIDVKQTHLDDDEAIERIVVLTEQEIKDAFQRGFFECKLRGEVHQVHFRDSHLALALYYKKDS